MIISSEVLKCLKIEEENQQTIAKAELTKNSAAKKLVQLTPESDSQVSGDEDDDTLCKLYGRRWLSYKRKKIWEMVNMGLLRPMYLSKMYAKRCRPQWRFLLMMTVQLEIDTIDISVWVSMFWFGKSSIQ